QRATAPAPDPTRWAVACLGYRPGLVVDLDFRAWVRRRPGGGPGAGGSTGPGGSPFLVAGMVPWWSGWVRQGGDPVPGGHDRGCPRPGCGDLQVAPPAAAGEPGCGVQEAVSQGLGLGVGEGAVEGEQPEPGEQGRGGQGGGQPGLVDGEQGGGELADSGVLAGADVVL